MLLATLILQIWVVSIDNFSVLWIMELVEMHIELLSLVDQISERSEQELSNVINLKVSIWLLLSLFDILFQDVRKLNQFSKLNSKLLDHLIVVIDPPGLIPFHNSSEFLMKES